jgi:hypothetical protein
MIALPLMVAQIIGVLTAHDHALSNPQLTGNFLCSRTRVDREFLIRNRPSSRLHLTLHPFTGGFGQDSNDRPY